MPLHAHDPARVVVELDGLNELIGRPRDGNEAAAERLDDLVMEAVDLEVLFAQHLTQPAPRGDRDLVCRLVTRLFLAVLDLGARIARDVLVEASAERDVEHLDAAADREERSLLLD